MDALILGVIRFILNMIIILSLIIIFYMMGRYGSCARADYLDWDDNTQIKDNSDTFNSSVFGSNSDTSDNSVSLGNSVTLGDNPPGIIVPIGVACTNNICCIIGSTKSCRSVKGVKLA